MNNFDSLLLSYITYAFHIWKCIRETPVPFSANLTFLLHRQMDKYNLRPYYSKTLTHLLQLRNNSSDTKKI